MGSPGTFLSILLVPHFLTHQPQSNCSVGYTMRNMRKSRQVQENPPMVTHSGALLLHRQPRSQQPSNWAMPKQQDIPIPLPIPRQTQTSSNNNSSSNSVLHRHRRHRTISANASIAHSSR